MKEIESKEAFITLISNNKSITSVAFQGVDLSHFTQELRACKFDDCIFMGCQIDASLIEDLTRSGNAIFPSIPLPYKIFRNKLYTGKELYSNNLDKSIYEHYLKTSRQNDKGSFLKGFPRTIRESFARSVHDHGISDSLEELLEKVDPKQIVAVMGGHGLQRTEKDYIDIVWMSKKLTEDGFILLSGGGPGAMEATHVGASLAGYTNEDVERALSMLATNSDFTSEEWLTSAFKVIEKYPNKKDYFSIGIPTWLYGHEPATPFATYIAKYFKNAIREENLLALAKGGIVFAPGSAGTIQEIFQDACQNHYESFEYASPMLFLNRACWMRDKPVFNLIQRLSENGHYKNLLIDINDDAMQLVSALQAFREGKKPKTRKHKINVATFNVLNLVLPEIEYYGKRKYNRNQYENKTDWIANQLDQMEADVVVFQEIFHKSALEYALKKSTHFKTEFHVAIGTRHADDPLLPMVAIASKYPIQSIEVFKDYETLVCKDYEVPGAPFSRPILRCRIDIHGQSYTFFGSHLKSKRPRYTELEKEDRKKSARVNANGTLRSLIQRGMEANSLRHLLVDSLTNGEPHFLIGDLNDSHNAVTNEIIGGNRPNKPQSPKYHLQNGIDEDEYKQEFKKRVNRYHEKMEDYHEQYQLKMFQAKELLARRSYQDHYFTHIHQGHHEALDHVYLSNDFSPFNPAKMGQVKQVKLFNDHLEDDTLSYVRGDFSESDHGQVVVKLEVKTTQWV